MLGACAQTAGNGLFIFVSSILQLVPACSSERADQQLPQLVGQSKSSLQRSFRDGHTDVQSASRAFECSCS